MALSLTLLHNNESGINTGICIEENECSGKSSLFPLYKRDADLSSFKFVNFRVGVPACIINDALNADNWPLNVHVRNFRFIPKNESADNEQM